MKSIQMIRMTERIRWKFYITGMLTSFSFLLSYTQPTLKSSVNRQQILIGEQFTLKVEASFSAENYRLKWLTVPDSMQHFEVVTRGKVDSVYSNSQLTGITQIFTLTSFDSGKWTLPSFKIGIQPASIGKPYDYFTDSFPVTVSFSVSDTSSQLRDIKPIREVEVKSKLWYWIAGGILLLALIVFLIWLNRRKKISPSVPLVRKSMLSPYDEAMDELKKLQQQNFSDPLIMRHVHTRIGEIIRQFLTRQENDNYLNKTTGDVLIFLKQINVSTELLTATAATLRLGDAVKFAKYAPPPGETEGSIAAATSLVSYFKQQVRSKPAAPNADKL